MSKKYKFKLQALLKLREFHEKKIKTELGEIVSEIQKVGENIESLKEQIDEAYKSYGSAAESGANGNFLQFYPYYIQGKREEIKNKENLIYGLERRAEMKRLELNHARGEVKVVEKLKEKDFQSWKKQTMKKDQEKIDDLMTIRRNLERKV